MSDPALNNFHILKFLFFVIFRYSMKMSTKKQTDFKKEWLQDPDFKLWLQEVPTNRTKTKCKLCQKTIE